MRTPLRTNQSETLLNKCVSDATTDPNPNRPRSLPVWNLRRDRKSQFKLIIFNSVLLLFPLAYRPRGLLQPDETIVFLTVNLEATV